MRTLFPYTTLFRSDLWMWKCNTARLNALWKVGMSIAPTTVAKDAENNSQRKSVKSPLDIPCLMLSSMRFARNGPWNEASGRSN